MQHYEVTVNLTVAIPIEAGDDRAAETVARYIASVLSRAAVYAPGVPPMRVKQVEVEGVRANGDALEGGEDEQAA